MEHIAGGLLIIFGLLIGLFGGSRVGSNGAGAALPAWLDNLLKWGMGLAFMGFGVLVLLGRARF